MDKDKIIKAISAIAKEKNIDERIILEGLEQALITAYKKNFDNQKNVRVAIDPITGDIKVFTHMIVVDDFTEIPKPVEGEDIVDTYNYDAEVLLEDILEKYPEAKVGDIIEEEVTPHDFGRVAAATAKQVITQRIREAEKNSIIDEFADKQDEMMLGLLAMEDVRNYYVDLGRTRGILPKDEMIPGEEVKMGTSIKVYITKVEAGPKGPVILLSRKHYGFVKRLLEQEIPEFAEGTIELYSVARDAGIRSKVAVFSHNERIDPIGACIGERGSRISNILKELNGEKIDLILYKEDPIEFITNALSPAKNVNVSITDEKERMALAIVDDANLPLAIGKKGSNVRLASKLTRYKIDVKTIAQITDEINRR